MEVGDVRWVGISLLIDGRFWFRTNSQKVRLTKDKVSSSVLVPIASTDNFLVWISGDKNIPRGLPVAREELGSASLPARGQGIGLVGYSLRTGVNCDWFSSFSFL